MKRRQFIRIPPVFCPQVKDNVIVCLSSDRLPNQFLSAKPSDVLSIYLSTFKLEKGDICVNRVREGYNER